jgi:chromosome segregation protein
LTELRATQAASGERLEAAESEGARLRESAAELHSRLEQLRADAGSAKALIEQNAGLREKTQVQLSLFATQGEELKSTLELGEGEIARCQQQLSESEKLQAELRNQVESCREKTRDAELARARAESERGHLDALCMRELGIPVAEAHLEEEAPTVDGENIPDLDALEKEIEQIKQKIERLGPVNMTAIEEFSELEERFGFLAAQREDLQRSMDSLRESIRRVNRESRQRFSEAFDAIRQSYQEVYKMLFSGGRADLRLEDEDDVLECGIEILAQPPGKKLAGVHLLSGGEKALSAIALLFAIFRYRPSPFCLLDEVDAALDDSNVGRFIDMVGEYAKNTQFIVVTHNKLSMEAADLLYGVTMQEPGVSKVVSLELGPATEHAQPSWKPSTAKRRSNEATAPLSV